MDSRPDTAEEVHHIHGTRISFSSKPNDLDANAEKELRKIQEKCTDGLKVHGLPFEMDPQDLPKGFFLGPPHCITAFEFSNFDNPNCTWRPHDSGFGYGIGHHASGYQCFKKTFVYQKGNHKKTHWIMVVYSLISGKHDKFYIKHGDVALCHVFQSDSYDPRPNPSPRSGPNSFDFHKKEVDSRMLELEGLMKNPLSFNDCYEFEEMYSKLKANGRNGKRAKIWEDFTEIEVLGPDGEVMLTLAICHGCNMAYKTGKWDPIKRKLTNNGTNTLKEHYRKCSDHRHISGNPQGAHH